MRLACFTSLTQRGPGAVGGPVDKAFSVRGFHLSPLARRVTFLPNSPLLMCK